MIVGENIVHFSFFVPLPTPIHHTYGPHVDRAYLWRALMLSYQPWRYRHGPSIEKLRSALKEKFHSSVSLFSSGREGLLALLRALDVRPGQEVIVQGYTCIVVPNAIHAAGAVPVYADIDPETLNLTRASVEAVITDRTKAIICQHTFGIPAPLKQLRELCDERDIVLIEDCAHILPDTKGPEGIGMIGDYAILSFGRDKAISGVAGGAVIARSTGVATILRELERTAVALPLWTTAMLLEYPSRMHSIVRPLSRTMFLKPVLWILQKLTMIVPVVTKEEKDGHMSPVLHKIPNVCAELALTSLQKLPRHNERRRTLTSFFLSHGRTHNWPIPDGISADLPLQKFPIFVTGAPKKRAELLKSNIHLDDGWTGCVICPESVTIESAGYEWGKDPIAEQACTLILNLPTHPTMTLYQAQILARRIDELLMKN